jgi:hypothetical protein
MITRTRKFDTGEQVLVLRPRIVDLDVTAPDAAGSARTRTCTTTGDEMTPVREAGDS